MTVAQNTGTGIYREAERTRGISISFELIAYVLLATFALVLRLAELDTTPLTAPEAREALAAWRAVTPSATGTVYAAQSQIIFLAQTLGFALFGGSEFSARFFTALAGAGLVLSPLLFRSSLGRARAFVLSILLAFSPVLLIGSRESAGVVWAGLFAVGAIRSLIAWRHKLDAGEAHGTMAAFAAICASALLFLCGAGGVVMAVVLALSVVVAFAWQRRADDLDETDSPYTLNIVRQFPFSSALMAALAMLLVAGTSFLLYPAGFSAVGSAFAGLLPMIMTPEATPFHALVTSIFYEPYLWVGAAAVLILLVRGDFGITDRFFIVAILFAAAAGLIFGGAPGANALWLTLPLAGLVSGLLMRAFEPESSVIYLPPPSWARWVVAIGLIGALTVFTIAIQDAARSMLSAADGLLSNASFPPDAVVLVFVSVSFIIIGFFLFASLWGSRTAWQGVLLGGIVFFCITSIGSGWAVAVSDSELPAQVWRDQTTSRDTALLRTTLSELTKREARGFNGLPVSVLAENDGVMAWLLRDYPNTTFISEPRQAAQEGVVLLPAEIVDPPLSAPYVGQDFVIEKSWDAGLLYLIDIPAWWTQRLARIPVLNTERYVLWLRQDIYEGVVDGLRQLG